VPPLNIADARSLLVRVVQDLYGNRHSPVPGALVKAQFTAQATASGDSFNEREHGLKNFLEFVKGVPEIAVQIRVGSDMLLAPATAGDLLSAYARPLPRLRRDFWRAFIEFPIPNTVRMYDTAEDKIYVDPAPSVRKGIVIDPIPKETQIAWRRSFAEEQPETVKGALLASLEGVGTAVFNEFSRRLRENPTVMHSWNRYLQKQVTDKVAEWAAANGISEDRWCSGTSRADESSAQESMPLKTHSIGQRAELYNFLDSVPIEDLLQLRVPLDWILKVTREKK
jgi:hypothetical protein